MEHPTKSATGRSWHWTGPSTLQAARQASLGTRRFLAESGLPEEDLAAWELVIAEAANNCVLHDGECPEDAAIDLLVTVTPEKVIARLRDQTPGFDWPDDPELPDDEAEGGRGLFLIHSLTDARLYTRSPRGNILELERACGVTATPPEDLEATLCSMTEELSSCYESLASIFHFIGEARSTASLEDFAARVLDHLVQTTSAELGVLRVAAGGPDLVTLAHHGVPDLAPLAIETEASESFLDRWIEGPVEGLGAGRSFTGIVHPFSHEDERIGTLLLARSDLLPPFNAGEVNMIRTFSEFLTQHILGRRHEEAAIRSSVARHEFELAASIQRSLLPPVLPPVAGVSATGYCESALSIGGDFYDLVPLEGRGFFFVIADVMGKGVAASMIAAVTRSAVRSLPEDFDQPARLLGKVAGRIFDDLDRLEMFVTIAVGVVDVPAGVVRIANAGHCPVVVAGESTALAPPDRPPLGIERDPVFHQHEILLTPGTMVLAYTDGFIDPRNKVQGFIDEEQVARWFADQVRNGQGLPQHKEQLLSRLGHDGSPGSLADDQTFLILSFT